jgi:sodium/potassium-transporting ATPase subunit alpha
MKTFELAFNSKDKFMIRTLALSEPAGLKMALSPIEEGAWKPDDLLLTIKGAPDIIVGRCSKYVGEDGNVHALDAAMKSVIEDVQNEWSSQGKRVILLARKTFPGHRALHFPEHNSFETDIL